MGSQVALAQDRVGQVTAGRIGASPGQLVSAPLFLFQAMGRIFVGLCQVGAWGCFDEFNRLEERMLSAVSQQVQCIQEALREHSNPNFDKSKASLLHGHSECGGVPRGLALIGSEGAFHQLPALTVAGRRESRVQMEGKPTVSISAEAVCTACPREPNPSIPVPLPQRVPV